LIDDLCKAIKTRYDSASGDSLRAVATGGLWFTQAKQNVSAPYIVFSWVGSTTEEYMGSGTTSKIEKAELRFSLFSLDIDGGTVLANAVYLLQNLFDWCSLSITGYTHVAFERTGTAAFEKSDDIWSATVNYIAWFDG